MDFELVGDLTDVETIATGRGIRELPRLRRLYGKGYWRKMKGSARIRLRNGRIRLAEIHWYKRTTWQERVQAQAVPRLDAKPPQRSPGSQSASATGGTRRRSSATKSTRSCPTTRLSGMVTFESSTRAARTICSPPTASSPSRCRRRSGLRY